ncbi:MAG TPA: FixH family protein [Rhizomicrobium sp.]|nr:FixH family protein [Rhizomicrobium sp.]
MTREITGRQVLIWLVGFFALVMAVNTVFIAVSLKTFRGEDEQKPYLQGVEYNRTLALRAEQEKAGWRAAIGAVREASGAVRISVSLKRPNGSPESQVALKGELRHPADENKDRAFALTAIGPDSYRAEIPGVSAGTWDVVVTALDSKQPFEASRRLWVP